MTAMATSCPFTIVEWEIRTFLEVDYYVTFSILVIFQTNPEIMLRIAFSTIIPVCIYICRAHSYVPSGIPNGWALK
jgi:hypothetical protein